MENNKYYYIIGQKLKEIRLKKGLSLEELGKRVGRTKKTIQRYENGEHKLTLEIIKEITDALDYDWDSMEGYLLDTFRVLNNEPIRNILPSDIRYIKVYGKICAGNGKTAYEDIIDEIYCPYPNLTGNLIALKVDGNSMDKVVKDGDYAIIRIQPTVENGSIAAIIIDSNDGMLKRFYRLDHETVVLKPESTDENYKPIIFTKEEINKIRIIGKFVGYVSPYLGDC